VTTPLALQRELARKAIHLLSAAAPIAYAGGLRVALLAWTLGAAAALAIIVELGRRTSAAIQRLLDRSVGALFREHEHASVTGATWLVLALLGSALLLPRPLAIATMWAVAVGDPAAALVGRSIGRVRLRAGGKSLEGALACLAITFAGSLLVAGLPVPWAAAAGFAAAVAEWPRGPFDDNLRIAVVVGATLSILRMFAA
jgi:dolichol kinase